MTIKISKNLEIKKISSVLDRFIAVLAQDNMYRFYDKQKNGAEITEAYGCQTFTFVRDESYLYNSAETVYNEEDNPIFVILDGNKIVNFKTNKFILETSGQIDNAEFDPKESVIKGNTKTGNQRNYFKYKYDAISDSATMVQESQITPISDVTDHISKNENTGEYYANGQKLTDPTNGNNKPQGGLSRFSKDVEIICWQSEKSDDYTVGLSCVYYKGSMIGTFHGMVNFAEPYILNGGKIFQVTASGYVQELVDTKIPNINILVKKDGVIGAHYVHEKGDNRQDKYAVYRTDNSKQLSRDSSKITQEKSFILYDKGDINHAILNPHVGDLSVCGFDKLQHIGNQSAFNPEFYMLRSKGESSLKELTTEDTKKKLKHLAKTPYDFQVFNRRFIVLDQEAVRSVYEFENKQGLVNFIKNSKTNENPGKK